MAGATSATRKTNPKHHAELSSRPSNSFREAVLPSTPRGGRGAVEDSDDLDHMVEQDRSQRQPCPGALGQWGACSRRAPSSPRGELNNVMPGRQKEMQGFPKRETDPKTC
ncbi:uncharacterized protein M6G45_005013 [Spheniscus humboldti]